MFSTKFPWTHINNKQDWGGGDVGGRGEGGEITDLIDFLTKDGGGK